MNKLLLLSLLFLPLIANAAKIEERTMKVLCGGQAEILSTVDTYSETPLLLATNESNLAYSIWANTATHTSTWIVKLPEPDTYCVIGVGSTLSVLDPNTKKIKMITKPID